MNRLLLRFLRLFPQFREAESWEPTYKVAKECLDTMEASRDDQFRRAEQWRKEAESSARQLKEVRGANHTLTTDKILLQDRLESALADKSRLWELVTTSLDSERQSLRMQINESWRARWGTTPFPEAPTPPDRLARNPDPDLKQMGRGFTPPSEQVRKATAKALQDLLDPQAVG